MTYATSGRSGRPVSVRAASGLLLVEVATAGIVVGLCLLGAVLTAQRRQSGDWSDLAIAVLLVLAAAALTVAVLLAAAWVALARRRRTATVVLSLLGHLAPTLSMVVLGLTTGTGQNMVVLGMAAVGLVGITLTLAPDTRTWLRGDPATG